MEVRLFSQPTCGMCRAVHMLLDKKGIEYKECQDVDYMATVGVHHTPTLEVDGVRYSGKEIYDWINRQ